MNQVNGYPLFYHYDLQLSIGSRADFLLLISLCVSRWLIDQAVPKQQQLFHSMVSFGFCGLHSMAIDCLCYFRNLADLPSF